MGGSNSVADTTLVGKVNKEVGDQVSDLKQGSRSAVDKNSSNKQSDRKEDNLDNTNGVSSKESKVKEGDDKKGKSDDGLKAKEVPKEKGNEGYAETERKEGSRGEECGSSNKCIDEENKFVACLRVPGNDSPDLSLLIQNKGKGPLSITISAPDFVKLEETKVELQEKEDKKVKVSVENGGPDNLITLTAGNGHCSLDFRDLIVHNSEEESDNSLKLTYLSILSQKSTIALLSFAALFALATGWMYISFRRRQLSKNSSNYQRLDMELPVSGGGKSESNINEGWNNNWDDDWEDEEAPKTPSMPVTPSLSSKGLAPRRLNKEGWKD
ncbi:hypothetical protein CFOL_v3_09293 [Cephalotus follicularis]|uniref:DUF7356 domain-containing protein n=1 Tax=Cephalotus follicularis TaxID=3775 RepID=A0A1Q3BD00_CEPFO|nr:hypothetical protein CFOL_v3_09293 [Cephalotus follicularis]